MTEISSVDQRQPYSLPQDRGSNNTQETFNPAYGIAIDISSFVRSASPDSPSVVLRSPSSDSLKNEQLTENEPLMTCRLEEDNEKPENAKPTKFITKLEFAFLDKTNLDYKYSACSRAAIKAILTFFGIIGLFLGGYPGHLLLSYCWNEYDKEEFIKEFLPNLDVSKIEDSDERESDSLSDSFSDLRPRAYSVQSDKILVPDEDINGDLMYTDAETLDTERQIYAKFLRPAESGD